MKREETTSLVVASGAIALLTVLFAATMYTIIGADETRTQLIWKALHCLPVRTLCEVVVISGIPPFVDIHPECIFIDLSCIHT